MPPRLKQQQPPLLGAASLPLWELWLWLISPGGVEARSAGDLSKGHWRAGERRGVFWAAPCQNPSARAFRLMLALAWVGTCRSLPLPGQKPSGASQALCHPGAAPRSRSFPAAPSAPSPRVPRDWDCHSHPWGPVAIQPGRRGLSAVLAPWQARLLFPCRAAGRGRDPCLRGNTLRISPGSRSSSGAGPGCSSRARASFPRLQGEGWAKFARGGSIITIWRSWGWSFAFGGDGTAGGRDLMRCRWGSAAHPDPGRAGGGAGAWRRS